MMNKETHSNPKVGTTHSSKDFIMSKQITGLAKYIIKLAHSRHYHGVSKAKVEAMLEMADLLNQFAEADNKAKQLEWVTGAIADLIEKSYKEAQPETKNEIEDMYWKSKGKYTHFYKKFPQI